MDDAPGRGVDTNGRRRACATDARPLEVTDVRGHGTDAGRGDAVRERGRELHHGRAAQREGFGRSAHQGERCHDITGAHDEHGAHQPGRIRVARGVERDAEVADLCEEQNQCDRAQRQGREVASDHPHRPFGGCGRGRAERSDIGSQVVHPATRIPQRGPGAARECKRLEHRQSIEQHIGTEDILSTPNGHLAAHRRRTRRQELGDVVSERGGGRSERRAGEAHDEDAIVRDDEAARVRRSVGDASTVESLQDRPRLAEMRFVVRTAVGEVITGYPHPHDHALAVRHPIGPQHLRRGDALAGGEDEGQGFVFDGAIGVAHICGVDRIPEREPSPRPVQPVGVAPVTVRHADVQERSIGGFDTEGVALPVDRLDTPDLESLGGEAGAEDLRVGVAARCPEHEVDTRADHPAQGEAADHIRREVRADVDARDRDQHNEEPRRPAGRSAEIGTGDGRHRGRDCNVRRGERQSRCHGAVEDDTRDELVGRSLRDDRIESLGAEPCHEAAEHDQLRQARPPAEHAHHCDDRHRRERPQLHDADERRTRRIGQLVDEPEEVELRAGSDPSTPQRARPRRRPRTRTRAATCRWDAVVWSCEPVPGGPTTCEQVADSPRRRPCVSLCTA